MRPISGGDDWRYSHTETFADTAFLDDADVEGFLNLRLGPDAGHLRVEPQPDVLHAGCETTLTWRHSTETELSDAAATLTGTLAEGTRVELAVSEDGVDWTVVETAEAGAFALSVGGPAKASGEIQVRVRATVPASGDAAVALDSLTLEADVAAPDSTIRLDPPSGDDTWTEDFTTDAYLAQATLENPEQLAWSGANVAIGSLSGYANSASLTWTFESTSEVGAITASIGSQYASCPHWASYNTIEVLDNTGAVVASGSTCPLDSGAYTGALTVTAELPVGSTAFSVRYGMVSGSGVASSSTTNEIDDLEVVVAAGR